MSRLKGTISFNENCVFTLWGLQVEKNEKENLFPDSFFTKFMVLKNLKTPESLEAY